MTKRKSPFAGKVKSNSEKQARGKGYKHLNIPNGMKMYKEDSDVKTVCDHMPYVVKTDKHPDRDERKGVAMPGTEWYKLPYKIHRKVGVNEDTIVCPTSIGLPCPLCEYKALRMKEGETWKQTLDLKPSDRNIYCIIPKGMAKWDEVPHLWDIAQFNYQNQLNNEVRENEKYEVFPDLYEGFTVITRFTKEPSGDGSFNKANRIDFEPRKNQYDEDWLKKIPCLDDVLVVLSYEEIEALAFDLATPSGSEQETETESIQEQETDSSGESVPDSEPDDIDETASIEKERKRKTVKPEPTPDPDPEPDNTEQPMDPNTCVACEGNGKDSKGKKCRICRGTGKKLVKKEPEPENETERCPFGHTFGKSTDDFEDCLNCDEWDDCIEEKGE